MQLLDVHAGFAHVSGLVTSGYFACPACGSDLCAERAHELGKEVYMDFEQHLPMSHPFRNDPILGVEERPPP